jgi:5'-methylthioadenosine phosphorylase
VTDYDVWHDGHDAVTVEAVIQTLLRNVATAKDVLRRLIPDVAGPRTCGCPDLLRNAVITPPAKFPPGTRRRLDLLLSKYFPSETRSRPAPKPGHPRPKPGQRPPLQQNGRGGSRA